MNFWKSKYNKKIYDLSYEKLVSNPEYEIKNTDKVNVAKYEKMKLETRERLVEFFRPYNKKLFGLLNRQFDWDK